MPIIIQVLLESNIILHNLFDIFNMIPQKSMHISYTYVPSPSIILTPHSVSGSPSSILSVDRGSFFTLPSNIMAGESISHCSGVNTILIVCQLSPTPGRQFMDLSRSPLLVQGVRLACVWSGRSDSGRTRRIMCRRG